jgi:hypothetical protein
LSPETAFIPLEAIDMRGRKPFPEMTNNEIRHREKKTARKEVKFGIILMV